MRIQNKDLKTLPGVRAARFSRTLCLPLPECLSAPSRPVCPADSPSPSMAPRGLSWALGTVRLLCSMFFELHSLRFTEARFQVHQFPSTAGLPCAGATGLLGASRAPSAGLVVGDGGCARAVGAAGLGSRPVHWRPRLQSTSHTLLKSTRAPVKFTLSCH